MLISQNARVTSYFSAVCNLKLIGNTSLSRGNTCLHVSQAVLGLFKLASLACTVSHKSLNSTLTESWERVSCAYCISIKVINGGTVEVNTRSTCVLRLGETTFCDCRAAGHRMLHRTLPKTVIDTVSFYVCSFSFSWNLGRFIQTVCRWLSSGLTRHVVW
jgi:hypothetical protein